MASPVKRRVLAPLDANAAASPAAGGKQPATTTAAASRPRLVPASLSTAAGVSSPSAKRSRSQEDGHDRATAATGTTPKKICRTDVPRSTLLTSPRPPQDQQQQQPSPPPQRLPSPPSPAASSVFDLSTTATVDTSLATALTEPDVGSPHAYDASARAIARDLSRQRAEILMLRLRLARYKLRTGQVDVPLEQLRVVPAGTGAGAAGAAATARVVAPAQSPLRPSRSASRSHTPTTTSHHSFPASAWVRQQQQQQLYEPTDGLPRIGSPQSWTDQPAAAGATVADVRSATKEKEEEEEEEEEEDTDGTVDTATSQQWTAWRRPWRRRSSRRWPVRTRRTAAPKAAEAIRARRVTSTTTTTTTMTTAARSCLRCDDNGPVLLLPMRQATEDVKGRP
ncbi:Transcription factor Nrm1/Whi5 [Niveomyces insectorum RCEF 264]|uniref:Transcription factor Nrm1/Whi5 n=1 Tax=Niveomyces insectorum RCEF 264 TaxID=1081102 RepID=A0A167NIL7_9HYPO|nr:Transcription factor Nrm1/Whi5 [Niveomyces insectorum RCEF 264]